MERASLDLVNATPTARALLAEIIADHGPVLFHQSGGCCDGSSPMCYPRGDFIIGDRDVLLGQIGETPFYIGILQFETWKHTRLTLDVVPGRGGMFSLDNGREQHFLVRSNLCDSRDDKRPANVVNLFDALKKSLQADKSLKA